MTRERPTIEILPHAVVQERRIDQAVRLGDPDPLAEVANGLRRHSATAVSRQGRHPRVVPTAHVAVLDQPQEAPLAHDRVGEVEPRELDLLRVVDPEGLAQPVVERAVVLVLEGAEGVRDPLDRVREGVRVVVHRVDAPPVLRSMVRHVADPVERRVAHVHVGRRHVDLRPEDACPIGELAGAHPAEQVQVLLHGSVAVRAVPARLGQGAAVSPDVLGREVVDVGETAPDQLLRPLVQLPEVVGREVEVRAASRSRASGCPPGSTRHTPTSSFAGLVSSNRRWHGAAELPSEAEVDRDRLRVADVEVAVGLGRESRDDAPTPAAGARILLDGGPDEVGRRSWLGCRHGAGARRRDRGPAGAASPHDTPFTKSLGRRQALGQIGLGGPGALVSADRAPILPGGKRHAQQEVAPSLSRRPGRARPRFRSRRRPEPGVRGELRAGDDDALRDDQRAGRSGDPPRGPGQGSRGRRVPRRREGRLPDRGHRGRRRRHRAPARRLVEPARVLPDGRRQRRPPDRRGGDGCRAAHHDAEGPPGSPLERVHARRRHVRGGRADRAPGGGVDRPQVHHGHRDVLADPGPVRRGFARAAPACAHATTGTTRSTGVATRSRRSSLGTQLPVPQVAQGFIQTVAASAGPAVSQK